MPYTPPSHRSPASSTSASPDTSRRPSLQSTARPSLPRSTSYLTKHRRTPSVTGPSDGSPSPLTPQGTWEDLRTMPSVRQSPPPRSDEQGMPRGAILSPPDSASSGSDDEGHEVEIRGRKTDKLKDLRAAISQIPQVRTPSPAGEDRSPLPERATSMRFSFSTSALGELATSGRKSSHVRSVTEPDATSMMQAGDSVTVSEDDTDEDLLKKPQMVRKKSGELVRPALRPSSRRRPSSMPGTPIFSKAVHFDSHLEHVRHFLQVDRPLAVSAGSSPVDNYDSEHEYPFPNDARSSPRAPPFEWEIQTSNFPHDGPLRKSLPVRLEKVWLSADQKSLLGSVAVSNLAFHKLVICRFTMDYWKTTSEVGAEYSHEIRPRESPLGHDRFTFSIKLSDMANLESKTLYFCIRYSVNGEEFWDNNANNNFQVDFRKKHLPQKGKNNFQGASSRPANGLPRSSRRQSPASTSPRPKSMPVSFDDFDNDPQFADQPLHEYLGETNKPLRLKSKSQGNLASDNLVKGLSSPSGAAFANRYDFGASLTAAVQAAKDSMSKDKDGLYMKPNVRGGAHLNASVLGSVTGSPAGSGTGSPNPSLPSASYEELVNKYCFFGSKQSSPAMSDGTLGSDQLDGPHAAATGSPRPATVGAATTVLTLATGSESPPTNYKVESRPHHVSRASEPNPYFDSTVVGHYANSGQSSQQSTPKSSLTPLSLTEAGELPYHAQQHLLAQRYPWGGESPAATAIRG